MKTKLLYGLLLVAIISFTSCNDDEKPKTAPTVVTVAIDDITTTTAKVTGTIEDDGNVTITETGVIYSSLVAEPTTADNKVQLTDTEGDFSAVLEGLSSGTTYHVRAYAINSKGTGYGEVKDFTTGNAAPTVSDVTITGILEVNKEVTATYTYTDAEGDAEGATVFQWYVASDGAGTGETAIDGATAQTFLIQDEQNGKHLRVSVTPKAATGTTTGMEVKSTYTGSVGAETVTFMYNGVEVTYGTIISTTTQRKWLDRNLGAGRVAQSIDDYQAYGDLLQWGRLADGHQLITRTGTNDADATGVNGISDANATSDGDVPGTNKFIIRTGFGHNGDWRTTPNNDLWQGVNGINNPCPDGWRIATADEWVAEDIGSGADAFTKLKLPYTGRRSRSTGNIELSSLGLYWASTRLESPNPDGILAADYLFFDETTFYTDGIGTYGEGRAGGQACRCIKD